jgi:hypothetical protein
MSSLLTGALGVNERATAPNCCIFVFGLMQRVMVLVQGDAKKTYTANIRRESANHHD